MTPRPTLTDEELAAIESRTEAATPGPWRVEPDDGGHDFHGFATQTRITTEEWPGGGWSRYGFNPVDAEFISHARTDVPRLIAALRASRTDAENLEEASRTVIAALEDEPTPSLGAEMISAERRRQIADEGYSAEHDARHTPAQLIGAAMAYVYAALDQRDSARMYWPWRIEHFKPKDQISNLTRAGALIAAAIDRVEG